MKARETSRYVASACQWLIASAVLCNSALAVQTWGSNNYADSEIAHKLQVQHIVFFDGLYRVYIEMSISTTTNEVVGCTVFSNRAAVAKKTKTGMVRKVMNEDYYSMLAECDRLNADAFKKRLKSTRSHMYTSGDFRGVLGNYAYSSYPGTMWCGIGIQAVTSNDLGTLKDIDNCCRTHYSCEDSIDEGQIKHGLHNHDVYPRRHCRCDQQLFRCLKNLTDDEDADLVGHMYFNVLQIECFDYDYPRKCLVFDDDGFCKKHEKSVNSQREARYQWFINPSFKPRLSKRLVTPSTQPPRQLSITSNR